MRENLTKREREILKLFCYKNAQIANILTVEPSTVKTHVSRILKKLDEPTKIRALIKALKMGLINIYDIKTDYVDIGFWDNDGKYKTEMMEVVDGKME